MSGFHAGVDTDCSKPRMTQVPQQGRVRCGKVSSCSTEDSQPVNTRTKPRSAQRDSRVAASPHNRQTCSRNMPCSVDNSAQVAGHGEGDVFPPGRTQSDRPLPAGLVSSVLRWPGCTRHNLLRHKHLWCTHFTATPSIARTGTGPSDVAHPSAGTPRKTPDPASFAGWNGS